MASDIGKSINYKTRGKASLQLESLQLTYRFSLIPFRSGFNGHRVLFLFLWLTWQLIAS